MKFHKYPGGIPVGWAHALAQAPAVFPAKVELHLREFAGCISAGEGDIAHLNIVCGAAQCNQAKPAKQQGFRKMDFYHGRAPKVQKHISGTVIQCVKKRCRISIFTLQLA